MTADHSCFRLMIMGRQLNGLHAMHAHADSAEQLPVDTYSHFCSCYVSYQHCIPALYQVNLDHNSYICLDTLLTSDNPLGNRQGLKALTSNLGNCN